MVELLSAPCVDVHRWRTGHRCIHALGIVPFNLLIRARIYGPFSNGGHIGCITPTAVGSMSAS